MHQNKTEEWKLTEAGFELYVPQLYRPWYNYISNAEFV